MILLRISDLLLTLYDRIPMIVIQILLSLKLELVWSICREKVRRVSRTPTNSHDITRN